MHVNASTKGIDGNCRCRAAVAIPVVNPQRLQLDNGDFLLPKLQMAMVGSKDYPRVLSCDLWPDHPVKPSDQLFGWLQPVFWVAQIIPNHCLFL